MLPLSALPSGYIVVPVMNDYKGDLNYLNTSASDPALEPPNASAPRLEPPHLPSSTPRAPVKLVKTVPPKAQITSPYASQTTSTSRASEDDVQQEHLQQIAAQLALLNYNVAQLAKSLRALGPLPPSNH